MEQPPEVPKAERPDADWLDWGESGVVICEDGNTEGWVKVDEDSLVDIEP